jgi:hypothetical protein
MPGETQKPELSPAASTGLRILFAGALGGLALALNHFLSHWVLFTDTLMRRFLF